MKISDFFSHIIKQKKNIPEMVKNSAMYKSIMVKNKASPPPIINPIPLVPSNHVTHPTQLYLEGINVLKKLQISYLSGEEPSHELKKYIGKLGNKITSKDNLLFDIKTRCDIENAKLSLQKAAAI